MIAPRLTIVYPLLGLAEIRRMKLEWEDWMAPAIALCTAGLVLFWRVDRFGPVLATIRGDWQQPLSLAPRWAYHLGTAISLDSATFNATRMTGPLAGGALTTLVAVSRVWRVAPPLRTSLRSLARVSGPYASLLSVSLKVQRVASPVAAVVSGRSRGWVAGSPTRAK